VFDIKKSDNNEVQLIGRFDASQTDMARTFFDQLNHSVTIDLEKLDYISSAGLGVLMMVQKRLNKNGNKIKLIKVNKRVKEVLMITNFHHIVDIEE